MSSARALTFEGLRPSSSPRALPPLRRVRALAVGLLAVSSAGAAPAKPATKPPAPKPVPAPPPVGPLPILPSVSKVTVTAHGSALAIATEVSLPRGEWKGEPLRFYVAFGAPGPRAIDAHLVPIGDGALEADDSELGEPLAIERAPRRPPNAHPLLGRDTMAGVIVQVPAEALTKALAPGNMAALRIRSLVDVTSPDATGAISTVVRLGFSRGTPLTLGRIVAEASPPTSLGRVEARLCGPEADPHPLAVRGAARPPAEVAPVAPILAVRHPSDDLCVRLWTSGAKPQ